MELTSAGILGFSELSPYSADALVCLDYIIFVISQSELSSLLLFRVKPRLTFIRKFSFLFTHQLSYSFFKVIRIILLTHIPRGVPRTLYQDGRCWRGRNCWWPRLVVRSCWYATASTAAGETDILMQNRLQGSYKGTLHLLYCSLC